MRPPALTPLGSASSGGRQRRPHNSRWTAGPAAPRLRGSAGRDPLVTRGAVMLRSIRSFVRAVIVTVVAAVLGGAVSLALVAVQLPFVCGTHLRLTVYAGQG